MAWSITADVDEFDEAVSWFRERVPVTDAEYEELTAASRARAFHLASISELAIVQLVFDEVDRAIAKGTGIAEFRKQVREKLTGKTPIPESQLTLTFRNASQEALNTGRWHQLTNPDVTAVRPYWMLDVVMDTRTTEEICKPLNKTIKAHDDPWWLTHWPPLHHQCRTGVRALRRADAVRRGLTFGDPATGADAGFGLAPPVRGTELPMPNREKVDPNAFATFEHRRAQDPDNTNRGED